MSSNNDFWAQEKVCEEQFFRGSPFYMISTEELPWLLFENDEDFKEGTNMVAIAAAGLRLQILVDVIMNNHLHQVAKGLMTRRLSLPTDFGNRYGHIFGERDGTLRSGTFRLKKSRS